MTHPLYKPLLATSITAASILSGTQFSLSYVAISTLRAGTSSTPNTDERIILSQFRSVFRRGMHLCPTSAGFASVCCFANAFLTFRHDGFFSRKVNTLLAAGATIITLIPFTLRTIVPVEEPLLRKAAKMGGDDKVVGSKESMEETNRLMDVWITRNYLRTGWPFVGALIAWSAWFI